jgi:hypothetical protein
MDETNLLSLIRAWLGTNCQITTKFATVSFAKKNLQLNPPCILQRMAQRSCAPCEWDTDDLRTGRKQRAVMHKLPNSLLYFILFHFLTLLPFLLIFSILWPEAADTAQHGPHHLRGEKVKGKEFGCRVRPVNAGLPFARHGRRWLGVLENFRISTGSGAKFLQLAKIESAGIPGWRQRIGSASASASAARMWDATTPTHTGFGRAYTYLFFRDYFSVAVVCHRFLLMSNEIF